MDPKDYSLKRKLVENRHLKEWKVTADTEQQALYVLNNKHRLERNRLRFERITDRQVWSELQSRHQKELSELKQKQSDYRLKLQTHHLQEREKLKEWPEESKVFYK